MGGSRERVPIHLRPHFDIPKRVEKFDRQVEFFHEKLCGINQRSPATCKVKSLRRLPALLCPIILDSLRHLLMQFRHYVASRPHENRLIWIRRLFRVGQVHIAVGLLVFLSLLPFEARFLRKFLRNRVRSKIDAANKKPIPLDKNHIAGFRPNIQQHRTSLHLRIIMHEGIAQGCRGAIHNRQPNAEVIAHCGNALDHLFT